MRQIDREKKNQRQHKKCVISQQRTGYGNYRDLVFLLVQLRSSNKYLRVDEFV